VREQSESAKAEAAEWQRKYESFSVDSKVAVSKATSQKERALKQAQAREDSMRGEYAQRISEKVHFFAYHILLICTRKSEIYPSKWC
jgi:hypothetical protein